MAFSTSVEEHGRYWLIEQRVGHIDLELQLVFEASLLDLEV